MIRTFSWQKHPGSNGIDPVCAFHGLRSSEHVCLYCCLCFGTLTPDECWEDAEGVKWDMHPACAEADRER